MFIYVGPQIFFVFYIVAPATPARFFFFFLAVRELRPIRVGYDGLGRPSNWAFNIGHDGFVVGPDQIYQEADQTRPGPAHLL